MERFTEEINKETDLIPDAEKVDLVISPVSKEEMENELRAMNEAIAEDKQHIEPSEQPDQGEQMAAIQSAELVRIKELRENLEAIAKTLPEFQMKAVPPEAPPQVGEGDEGMEPVVMHEANVKYETCRNCKGKGRVMLSILQCPKCGGTGKAPALQQNWKSKVIAYRKKDSSGEK